MQAVETRELTKKTRCRKLLEHNVLIKLEINIKIASK
jgi:hypothetical protein